jgi:hypothetical protein
MIRSITRTAALVVLFAGIAANPGRASAQSPSDTPEDSRWSAHLGGGFTASPGAGLIGLGLEYDVAPQLGFGPLMQLAVDDHDLIVAPSLNTRLRFDLSDSDDSVLRRIQPFIQGGVGFAYVDKDRRGRDREDTELMLNGGAGMEYRVAPSLSLGTSVLFNGMPVDSAAGERFFFSWQILTARAHF